MSDCGGPRGRGRVEDWTGTLRVEQRGILCLYGEMEHGSPAPQTGNWLEPCRQGEVSELVRVAEKANSQKKKFSDFKFTGEVLYIFSVFGSGLTLTFALTPDLLIRMCKIPGELSTSSMA